MKHSFLFPPSAAAAPRCAAFTLIELLLLMTVLALAATLLQPLFRKTATKSDSAVCQDNLRQLGAAIRLAAEENNHVYPEIESSPDTPIHPAIPGAKPAGKPVRGLLDTLRPYGITEKKVQCPADVRAASSYYAQKGSSYMWLPYAEHQKLDEAASDSPESQPAAASSRLRLLTDFAAVHDQRMNVLYADGHLKMY